MGHGNGIALQLSGVSKRFDNSIVLQDLDLRIEKGEFIAIVGKSGCGKSTLLRQIAGLDAPTEGQILADGSPLTGIHPDARLLFQDARLLPWKKVIQNVKIGLKSNSDEIARSALRQVGLEERASEWPSILSGGQKQRIALARALACEPRLLLLDEPLGALDALTRIEMQQLIEDLWLDRRFTAILVTHDVSEAVSLADRVILIEKGKIAMDVKITLARPRERDSGFAYFEKKILDRVMEKKNKGVQEGLIFTI